MKIVAGLGCVDDYIRLVEAGADEVFCGYVPHEWNKKYGNLFPLNRREVLYYNVQIGSLEEMKILKKMVDVYKVPVTITFNYLYYLEEQYKMASEIMADLIKIGFDEFIIADIALVLYLKKIGMECKIHLSGECAEINRMSIEFFDGFKNISRYIFHRKNTLEDMKSCISSNKKKNMQYEAFILNERCHYTGAFCSSLHCDEMSHLCKVPYEFSKISEDSNHFINIDNKIRAYNEELEKEEYEEDISIDDWEGEEDNYMLGSTGCGICFLKELKDAGVTHLKVVGRGKYIDYMERDVRNLKNAIEMLDNSEKCSDYKKKVKNELIQGECSGECYY